MANNKLIWIGISSALVLGTGVFLFFYLKAKDKNNPTNNDKNPDNNNNSGGNSTGGQFTSQPVRSTSTSPSYSSGSSDVPFTNSTDGNKFRGWVNKNYPDYARSIQLDPTGSFNNSYIKKAWAKYGAEYLKASTPFVSTKPASEFKYGDGVYLNRNVQSLVLYSYPQIAGQYVKGTIKKTDSLDRPIGKFINVAIQGQTPSTTWVKVTIPTYRNIDSEIVNVSGDFYVMTNNISTTPY